MSTWIRTVPGLEDWLVEESVDDLEDEVVDRVFLTATAYGRALRVRCDTVVALEERAESAEY